MTSPELTPEEVRAWAYESPRRELQPFVPFSARRLLDLGCSSGAVGAALKARQPVEIVGVEIDPSYAQRAAERLDRVVQADLDELIARPDLESDLGRFDCILAGDVLEHLRDPWMVLTHAVELLEPGGTAVVSLPNVRHWDVLWNLAVRGTWRQEEQGIFDRTHLQWFTAADGVELLRETGLEPHDVRRVYSLRAVSGPRDPLVARVAKWRPLRPFFALQHIFVGRKPADGRRVTPGRTSRPLGRASSSQ